MMDTLDYLALQLRLEGKEILDPHWIREVEAVPGEDMPLMLIARLSDGRQVTCYEEALSRDLQEQLSAAMAGIRFPEVDPLLAILRQTMQVEVGHYKSYLFPSLPVADQDVLRLSNKEERVKAFGFDAFAPSVYVIERGGKVLSACVSARENEACGEAWVFTTPDSRHQGFAQKVVNAWARSLMNAGKVPFYSHKIDNLASARLAAKLGLMPAFEEIGIHRA